MVDFLRKVLRFSLAAFLWLHAFFLLNIHTHIINKLSALLHFASLEVILLLLLLVFSFVEGGGFWRTIGNLAYLYFFPFVLLFYFGALIFYLLRAFHRFTSDSPSQPEVLKTTSANLANAAPSAVKKERVSKRESLHKVAHIFSLPFRKFTILWCFLLLVTTHPVVFWTAFTVVLLHLGRIIIAILRLTLSSGTWFGELEKRLHAQVDSWAAKLHAVTKESPPDPELRNLWNALQGFELVIRFIQNESLISKWAMLLGATILGSIYIYVAFLFSFIYYGIAHIAGVSGASWTDSLVTSLFIPFYVADLPKNAFIRVLGGLHCALILTAGIGSIVKYFRRRVRAIANLANLVNMKLFDESLHDKRLILNDKFSAAAAPSGAKTAENGTVSVKSTPDGADVSADGDFMGNTPASLMLGSGKHTIRVSSSGYTDWTREITVNAGSDVQLNTTLEKH